MNSRDRWGADPQSLANSWLALLNNALLRHDAGAVSQLFVAQGHWRDLLAFTWSIETHSGPAAIESMLERTISSVQPRNFRFAARRSAPRRVMRAGTEVVEALFQFETAFGAADGVVRLVPDQDSTTQTRAWIVLTALDSLRGHEEFEARHTGSSDNFSREFGGENWLDKRNKARTYADRDPAVLIVGAGQAGLSLAARLIALGIDALIIDRNQRIGDNWRNRYHSLTLHNEVHVNHLPYMRFPSGWPVFIPKDKLANWLETYVESLDLNCWMGCKLTSGKYDPDDRTWAVTLRRADGSERLMRPRHLVFATGVSAIPQMPVLPGLAQFAGTVIHSGAYTEGSAWKNRKALVLGTGNSGHDVAQDLYSSGATVTMIQRSPTHVVSLREAQRVYSLYSEGIPFEDCDLLVTAMPYPVLVKSYQLATAMSQQTDQALLTGLAARGFRLTDGEDHTGFQMMYLRRGGGYYFNVGCSDLIIDGKIGLAQYDQSERFVSNGLLMRDGSTLAADLLVLATGYQNQQEVVRASLGAEIANRAGPAWSYDDSGELRNMWRPTTQSGLWFTAGSLAQCRIYSKYLALQIKAREIGLVTR